MQLGSEGDPFGSVTRLAENARGSVRKLVKYLIIRDTWDINQKGAWGGHQKQGQKVCVDDVRTTSSFQEWAGLHSIIERETKDLRFFVPCAD